MKLKIINNLFFLIPFVATVFNLQALVVLYISESFSQILAYTLIALLILGIFLNLKNIGKPSKTAGLWIFFYITYYCFATVASIVHNNPINMLVSIIPVIYFFAFYVYLSNPQNRKIFKDVALVSFVGSSLLCIYLFKINWDLDHRGIYIYNVDRAGGVFGDANNAALVAVIAFILVFKTYIPTKKIFKYFKYFLLLSMLYCLAITFSTTGYFVFLISFVALNLKFFTSKRIFFIIILLPIFYIALINLNHLTAGLDLTTPQRLKISNIVNLLTFNTQKVDNSGRGELLENLLIYVYKNPFFGNGVDFTVSIRGHNTIVGVWADAGIFGLLAFLIMLGNYFVKAIISSADKRYFVLSILIVMCVFMLSLQTVINQGYLMALFVYLGYILDEKKIIDNQFI